LYFPSVEAGINKNHLVQIGHRLFPVFFPGIELSQGLARLVIYVGMRIFFQYPLKTLPGQGKVSVKDIDA
jgi:hypothetical protein